MTYWLVKSDPESYSWQNLLTDGKTTWDGVRSYQARNNLSSMKQGEKVLFYHSQEQAKEIVGIAQVTKEAFQDPTTADTRWLAVEISAVAEIKQPVNLDVIKSTPELQNISLVKQGRLSVMPLSKAEFELIVKLGK